MFRHMEYSRKQTLFMLIFSVNRMKRIAKTSFFLFIFLVILVLIDAWSFTNVGDDILGRIFFSTGYRYIGSSSIVPAIEKSANEEGYTKIVLGDSVGNQVFHLFTEDNDDYLLLGTNQAITVTGQYILAKRFLDHNDDASDVYMVILPGGFSNDYSSPLSYSYLIEPFGKTGCLEELSVDTREKMEGYYGSFFINKSVICFLDGSCINNKLYLFYNQNREKKSINEEKLISNESRYYLRELKSICEEKNVILHVIPSPLYEGEDHRKLVEDLRKEIVEEGLGDIFGDYCERVTFYPAEYFGDGTHFGEKYSDEEHCHQYIDNIIAESSDFIGLVY